MSNISVSPSGGPIRLQVAAAHRISPSVQRVTFTGPELAGLPWQGFDQWVRLFLPASDPASLDHVPASLTRSSYLRMQALPRRLRPEVRSYTLRQWRPRAGELDIDFVVHGTDGVAGPWATAARPGEEVAILDQGCGWPHPEVGNVLLVADETGMPAVLGILRDLPAEVAVTAVVEVPEAADAQDCERGDNRDIHWLVRRPGQAPGEAVAGAITGLELAERDRHAFAVGESRLATGVRRHLVRDRGWAKREVTFCGYWRR